MRTHGTIKSVLSDVVIIEIPKHDLEEVSAMQGELLSVELRKQKDTRTLRQNRYIWLVIGLIDEKINGTVSDEMAIYQQVVRQAKIKTEYIQTLEKAKPNLEKVFRAVEEIERRESNGTETVLYRCYYGTSTFTKKEMADFIEVLITTAYNYGLDVKQYEDYLRK